MQPMRDCNRYGGFDFFFEELVVFFDEYRRRENCDLPDRDIAKVCEMNIADN